jgi:hypothetical protein
MPAPLPLLRLVRAPNLLIAAAGVFAGGWIALRAVAVPKELLFAAISALAIGAVGNAWNDIRDITADRVNRPETRPLAAGQVTRGAADFVVFAGVLLAIAFAGLVSGRQVLASVALAVMFVYSHCSGPAGWKRSGAVADHRLRALPSGARSRVVPWILAAPHFVRNVWDAADEWGPAISATPPIVVGGRPAQAAAGVALFVPRASCCAAFAAHGGVIGLHCRPRWRSSSPRRG